MRHETKTATVEQLGTFQRLAETIETLGALDDAMRWSENIHLARVLRLAPVTGRGAGGEDEAGKRLLAIPDNVRLSGMLFDCEIALTQTVTIDSAREMIAGVLDSLPGTRSINNAALIEMGASAIMTSGYSAQCLAMAVRSIIATRKRVPPIAVFIEECEAAKVRVKQFRHLLRMSANIRRNAESIMRRALPAPESRQIGGGHG